MRGDLDEILEKLKGETTREAQKRNAVREFEKSKVFMMVCKTEDGFMLNCNGTTDDLMTMLATLVGFLKTDQVPDVIIRASVDIGLRTNLGA